MAELKPDYRCEYAKSSLSSCRQCNEKIVKELVRIGKLERSSKFDGEIYMWHHVDCFQTRYGSKIGSAQDIKGLSELKWEDQDDLKKKFGTSGGGGESVDDEDSDDASDVGSQDVFVEYATSSRSTCKSCYANIGMKEVRAGVRENNIAAGYESTSYYHLICYTVPSDSSKVAGLNKLLKEDKRAAENHFDQELKRKREQENEMSHEEQLIRIPQAAKKRKHNESDKQKSTKLWEIKERLKVYNSNELKAILMYNKQDYKAGPAELINRIADAELNGTLPFCSKCKSGHLVYDTGIIKCVGHLSAWSGCTFTCGLDEISKRGTWKNYFLMYKMEYPRGIQLVELVEKVKMNSAKSKEVPTGSSNLSKLDKTLFKDMIASVVGDIPDDVADIIIANGGKVQATVSRQVTHLISTYEEVVKDDPVTKVANAIQFDIPIVSHAFVQTAAREGNLRSQPRFILWEGGAAVRINETVPTPKKQDNYNEDSTPTERKKLAVPVVDPKSQNSSGTILVDKGDTYSVMLSLSDLTRGQTGLNSFYKMQIIQNSSDSSYTLFRKWGRVGQDGSTTELEYNSKKDAMDEFKRIFYEKTRNTFTDFLNNNYEKKPGKFYPVELGEEEPEDKPKPKDGEERPKEARHTLDPRVAELVKLLFDTNMFQEQMEQLKIDTNKMPLGKLSKSQIAKGTAVLEEIESELSNAKPDADFLLDASNRFYTLIPHDFGLFEKPVIINTKQILQKRYDLLETLGDIEAAARMLDEEVKFGVDPIVQQYEKLGNKITAVEHNSEEFKIIKRYWDNTKEGGGLQIAELFRVQREGESRLFSKFNSLEHRKLLWHGSSVAVFAAYAREVEVDREVRERILNGGLKIMPHAGGRVGAGLYFADMIAKSAGYLGFHNNTGLVLLNEVALGNINRIQHDDSSLTHPPNGFDSVLAEGQTMPNPKDDHKDYSLSESGHPVIIPQGEVYNTSISSSFYHNEYLVYDQTQVSMRYLIKIQPGDDEEDY